MHWSLPPQTKGCLRRLKRTSYELAILEVLAPKLGSLAGCKCMHENVMGLVIYTAPLKAGPDSSFPLLHPGQLRPVMHAVPCTL